MKMPITPFEKKVILSRQPWKKGFHGKKLN
jgi:hypothetical protein